MRISNSTIDRQILDAVDTGLSAKEKFLPSWMFYDDAGNKIFQAIMNMPEYYPTKCEYEILQQNKHSLLTYFSLNEEPFQLIELGAGDGVKTEILLRTLVNAHVDFTYVPVDVSLDILNELNTRLKRKLPDVIIEPQSKKYEEAVALIAKNRNRKIVLFLGANIGNYQTEEATAFLKTVSSTLGRDDFFIVGFDLKKDPEVIKLAYNDPKGITKEFNLNFLRRINRELGADFDEKQFIHSPTYDPSTGSAKSYLVSKGDQTVHVDALEKSFNFRAWETIYTEVSQKYDLKMIEDMAYSARLEIVQVLYDSKQYFCDIVFRRK